MNEPQTELDRIFHQLHLCGVPVPRQVTLADIRTFIDPNLQHGRTALQDTTCTDHNDGDYSHILPPATWPTTDEKHIRLYRAVIRVFCALESRAAFHPRFQWDETVRDA